MQARENEWVHVIHATIGRRYRGFEADWQIEMSSARRTTQRAS